MRHGLICDLMGGATGDDDDLRGRTVTRLADKFGVDTAHGDRVTKVATTLFEQWLGLACGHTLADAPRHLRTLQWAARLHEIGSHISHSDYHKHGAYILTQRGRHGLFHFRNAPIKPAGARPPWQTAQDRSFLQEPGLAAQLLALRLAVILCHARRDPDLQGLSLEGADLRCNSLLLHAAATGGLRPIHNRPTCCEEVLAWQRTETPPGSGGILRQHPA